MKKILRMTLLAAILLTQPAFAVEYRSCIYNGATYSHGATNSYTGQTCDDGIWRG